MTKHKKSSYVAPAPRSKEEVQELLKLWHRAAKSYVGKHRQRGRDKREAIRRDQDA